MLNHCSIVKIEPIRVNIVNGHTYEIDRMLTREEESWSEQEKPVTMKIITREREKNETCIGVGDGVAKMSLYRVS